MLKSCWRRLSVVLVCLSASVCMAQTSTEQPNLEPITNANVNRLEMVASLTMPSRVDALAFDPTGAFLAAATDKGVIAVWNITTRKPQFALHAHSDRVWSMVFSRDGKALYSGSWDHSIRVLDMITGKSRLLTTMLGRVMRIALSPDGITLAGSGDGGDILFWNADTGDRSRTLTTNESQVPGITFSPDGRSLAVGTVYNFEVWDLESSAVNYISYGDPTLGAVFSPDGTILVQAADGGCVLLWNLVTHYRMPIEGEILYPLNAPNRICDAGSPTVSPDGSLLVAGGNHGNVRIWAMPSGRLLQTVNGADTIVYAIAFDPKGTLIATNSGNQVTLWGVKTNE